MLWTEVGVKFDFSAFGAEKRADRRKLAALVAKCRGIDQLAAAAGRLIQDEIRELSG